MMRSHSFTSIALPFALSVILATGCATSGADGTGGSTGTGGTTGGAGSSGIGGRTTVSDAGVDAPSVSTGGATGTGGATAGTGGATGTGGAGGAAATGFYHMERLIRGVVAVRVNGGNYVGWRMFGYEYDADQSGQRLVQRVPRRHAHRRRHRQHQLPGRRGHRDIDLHRAPGDRRRRRRRLRDRRRCGRSNYLRVPLEVPPGGNMPATCATPNEAYTYSANDASAATSTATAQYEIFLKWDPSNAKDNSQSGCTGDVFIDAYKLDGTRLWRIDLGPQHPRRRALHAVHRLRLRRRRQSRDGGQDRARNQGRHRRSSCSSAPRRTTTTRRSYRNSRPATSWPAPST